MLDELLGLLFAYLQLHHRLESSHDDEKEIAATSRQGRGSMTTLLESVMIVVGSSISHYTRRNDLHSLNFFFPFPWPLESHAAERGRVVCWAAL